MGDAHHCPPAWPWAPHPGWRKGSPPLRGSRVSERGGRRLRSRAVLSARCSGHCSHPPWVATSHHGQEEGGCQVCLSGGQELKVESSFLAAAQTKQAGTPPRRGVSGALPLSPPLLSLQPCHQCRNSGESGEGKGFSKGSVIGPPPKPHPQVECWDPARLAGGQDPRESPPPPTPPPPPGSRQQGHLRLVGRPSAQQIRKTHFSSSPHPLKTIGFLGAKTTRFSRTPAHRPKCQVLHLQSGPEH